MLLGEIEGLPGGGNDRRVQFQAPPPPARGRLGERPLDAAENDLAGGTPRVRRMLMQFAVQLAWQIEARAD